MTFHKSTRTHIEKRLLSVWKYKMIKYTVIFLRNEWSRSYIPFSQSTFCSEFLHPFGTLCSARYPSRRVPKSGTVRFAILVPFTTSDSGNGNNCVLYQTVPLSGNEPIKNIFCMTLFYIPNPTQYLNFTTTLLTIKNQQIRSLRQKS